MQTGWQGHYYNGVTARREVVRVQLTPASLRIIKTDSPVIDWPIAQILITQEGRAGEPARLMRAGESLLIYDAEVLQALRKFSPSHASRLGNTKERKSNIRYIAAAAAAAAFLVSLYMWIIPLGADYAAAVVPPQWEDKLGESVVDDFTRSFPQCTNTAATDPIDRIVKTLSAAAQTHPYKFKIHIVDNKMVNALAAPGGHIIVFTGLLEKTDTPEELAGVLAHEMQHVLKRHATRAVFQNLSTYMLFTLLTGGSSNAAGMANTFASLRYSRINEEEADTAGLRLLREAQIDPTGMTAFFEKTEELEKKRGKFPGVFNYLSTHPLTGDRLAYLNAEIVAHPYTPVKLLPDVVWKDVATACVAAKTNPAKEPEEPSLPPVK